MAHGVGCISAFVAVLTSVMGVAGTIIGSVISSVLYNMLTEALEKPVGQATFSTDFEWEIAYIFPLVVIALIQLLFILALIPAKPFGHDRFCNRSDICSFRFRYLAGCCGNHCRIAC